MSKGTEIKAATRKPDFIGIGAQKAGTSWIHACLYEHPQVYMPATKEVHFFSNHYAKGFEWYEDHFRDCSPEQVAGEFSPTYLYHPDAPRRIYDYNPKAKLIVCLRDPIERAISAYRYCVERGTVPRSKSFQTMISEHPAFLDHSFYYAQLSRYLEHFPKDQLLITLNEEIGLDPYRFMQDIYRFLRVDQEFRPSMALRRVNVSRGSPRLSFLNRVVKKAAGLFRNAGMDDLVWRVSCSWMGEAIRRVTIRTEAPVRLPAGQRAELARLFAEDVEALEKLMQRDLRGIWLDDHATSRN